MLCKGEASTQIRASPALIVLMLVLKLFPFIAVLQVVEANKKENRPKVNMAELVETSQVVGELFNQLASTGCYS